MIPLSLGLGAILASFQAGSWFTGLAAFSFLFLLSFSLLTLSTKWAGGGKTLAWMVALAFVLRLAGGVAVYLALPVYGYVDDEDQSAGFTYTDAHRRDAQAWDLAVSENLTFSKFSIFLIPFGVKSYPSIFISFPSKTAMAMTGSGLPMA